MSGAPLAWSDFRTRRVAVPSHVVFRAFPRETVLLNVRTGQYHSIDSVGSRFLETLQEGPDLDAASRRLAQEYEQPIERIQTDLSAFAAEMERLGLVELSG